MTSIVLVTGTLIADPRNFAYVATLPPLAEIGTAWLLPKPLSTPDRCDVCRGVMLVSPEVRSLQLDAEQTGQYVRKLCMHDALLYAEVLGGSMLSSNRPESYFS